MQARIDITTLRGSQIHYKTVGAKSLSEALEIILDKTKNFGNPVTIVLKEKEHTP